MAKTLLEKRNAVTISQSRVFENPLRAAPGERVPVSMTAIKPMNATQPMLTGTAMKPTIIAVIMASTCQASGLTPFGIGENQMRAPTITGIRNRESAFLSIIDSFVSVWDTLMRIVQIILYTLYKI